MTCAACANRIEKKLNKQVGVEKASVNYATARASVTYNSDETNTSNLISAVKDVGYYTAATAEVSFTVDDSARPSGSSQPLETYLNKLRGVVRSSFNLGTQEVLIEYLPGAES
ncbi:MAG: heavy-metal-associated domain-containing protein [Acidobacteriota bacterium]|nr:heavy-metal-associated domain-containing protein [Acidobacteriota bacterium]